MENEFFLNAGVQPPLHFEPPSSSSLPTWQSLSSAMEIQASVPNCSSEQTQDCFYHSSWEKSTPFGSALSSMVSSPAASNSNMSNNNFVIRELIGKLGNIGGSGEISPHSQPMVGGVSSYMNGNNSTNNSCYSTPLNSPPKPSIPQVMNHLVKEHFPSLGKSVALNSSVADFAADPGFAERAAKFSCFGSRSFNGRTSQIGLSNDESTQRSTPLMENGKISRVSSSPALKALGSQMVGQEIKNSPMEVANSQEESTISEQTPNGEAGGNMNSRKRKSSSKGKSKETPNSTNPPKVMVL